MPPSPRGALRPRLAFALPLSVALLPVSLAACSGNERFIDGEAHVQVASSFTAEELPEVYDGIHAWELASPDVHFTLSLVDDDTIRGENTGADTVRIGRAVALDDGKASGPCVVNDGAVGTTWPDLHTVCIRADLARAVGKLPTTVAHELGHALGLQHDDASPLGATVMRSAWVGEELLPTCLDAERAALRCTVRP